METFRAIYGRSEHQKESKKEKKWLCFFCPVNFDGCAVWKSRFKIETLQMFSLGRDPVCALCHFFSLKMKASVLEWAPFKGMHPHFIHQGFS